MANRWRNNGNSDDFTFLGSKITVAAECRHEIKDAYSLEEKLWQT